MGFGSKYISADRVLRIGKRRFLVGRQGADLSRFIRDLVDEAGRTDSVQWLIPYRSQFRRFTRDSQRALLTYVAMHPRNLDERRLAIWLRGYCGGSLGTPEIFGLYERADVATKITIVRSLKKMHAWSELSQIEQTATDFRLRNMAKPRSPRDLEDRLRKFAQHLDVHPIVAKPGKLVIADDVQWGGGKPPKPVWLIRKILQRIHLLVRGPNHAGE